MSEIRESRTRLEQALEASGIHFWPSEANFVLARVGSTAFIEQMRRRGILIRDRSSDQGCEGCVRITLGTGAHTDRLLAALQETLEELGMAQGQGASPA